MDDGGGTPRETLSDPTGATGLAALTSGLYGAARNTVRRFLPQDVRLRRARLSTLATAVTRGLNLATRFVSVPLLLSAFGPERLGVWYTMGNLLGWLALADLGAPTALINPLAAALARQDVPAGRRLVSSTFVFLLSMGGLILCVLTLLAATVDLRRVFNTDLAGTDLRWAVHLAIVFSAASLPLRLSRMVLVAQQQEYTATWADIASEVMGLTGIVALYLLGGTYTGLVLAVLGSTCATGLLLGVWVFGKKAPALRPSFRHADRHSAKIVSGDGVWFFLAFLGDLFIMQTDLFVISHAPGLGPSEVPRYATIYQLFFFSFVLIYTWVKPLWPAYADAAHRGDVGWIRRQHRRSLAQCVGAMLLVSAVLVLGGREIVRVWARKPEAVPPRTLILAMAAWFPVWMWAAVNGNLLNAIGGIRHRARVAIVSGLLNLTLSLLLVRRFGLVGVALGSFLALCCTEAIVMPLLVRHMLRGIERGTAGAGAGPGASAGASAGASVTPGPEGSHTAGSSPGKSPS